MSQMSSSGWLLAFIISLLLSLLMGLALVWLSIERTDKAYSIRQLRNEVEQRAVLKTKLEVERDRLLAPHVLRRKAIQLGMSEAKPGQIRRMPDQGPESRGTIASARAGQGSGFYGISGRAQAHDSTSFFAGRQPTSFGRRASRMVCVH